MAIVTDKSQVWRVVAAHAFLWIFLIITLFPFFVTLMISFTPGNFAGTGELIPSSLSLEHWKNALCFDKNSACYHYTNDDGKLVSGAYPVLKWLWNSIKVAGISAVFILLFSTTAAYAFARMKFRFRSQILNGLMLTQMFPSVLALVAIYGLFTAIGEMKFEIAGYVWNFGESFGIGTHKGLILAYIAGISMHVWTIRGYFDTIPIEIEEAAKVDGATPFQAFRYVLLPMALPILMVVFLFAFIGGVLEYPVASILLTNEDNYTFAIGSKSYFGSQDIKWGDFAAAAILSGFPITLVFMFAQKGMVSGLTSGGVKG